MLCEFAKRAPIIVSNFLACEKKFARRFREETITDIIMAMLASYSVPGVYIDFPDEIITGADMEWIFVAPRSGVGGRFIRLLIQAKRARPPSVSAKGKDHYYDHLDYGYPAGNQLRTLIKASAGHATVPLYMFYHSIAAITASGVGGKAMGTNLVLGHVVQSIYKANKTKKGHFRRAHKSVSYWNPHFLTLEELFCPPAISEHTVQSIPSPNAVAEFLRERQSESHDLVGASKADSVDSNILAINNIPPEIERRIKGKSTSEDQKNLETTRVIFNSDAS